MLKLCFPVALFLSLSLTASQSEAAVRYSITDLGAATTPLSINNNGQIVGSVDMEDGHSQAFVYQNGVLTELGTFGGTASVATGINTSGSIAGTFTTISGDTHGFLYQNGFIDLFGTAGIIKAKGINDSDVVLGLINGFYWETSPAKQTVLYDNGLLTNVSLAEGGDGWDSDPIALNNVGQVVFFQHICGDCVNSYLYNEGTLQGYGFFKAEDLNDSGHLVGNRPSFSAFQDELGLWYHDGEETVLNDILENDNYPRAINNKADIVGTMLRNDATHAFIYANSTLAELNTLIPPDSGWDLTEAIDINDSGEIIGFGKFQGDWHAYLLQPWQKVELQIISKVDTERLDSNRLLKAMILGSPDFDVATVDPETIKLAGAAVNTVGQKQRYLTDLKDINRDGLQDLTFVVPMNQLDLGTPGPIVLETETLDGQMIYAEANLARP